MAVAASGEYRSCSTGSPKPRQPGSSNAPPRKSTNTKVLRYPGSRSGASVQSTGDPISCRVSVTTAYSSAGRPRAYSHHRTGTRQRQTGRIQASRESPARAVTMAAAAIGPSAPSRKGTRPPPRPATSHRLQEMP